MKNVYLGGLLGGIAFFLWQNISWTVIPWHQPKNIPNDDFIAMDMKDNMPEPGVYHYPGFPVESPEMTAAQKQEAWNGMLMRFKSGPRISMLVYDPAGGAFMRPMQFVAGFILALLAAFIAAYLLARAALSLKYWGRTGYVLLIGLFAALLGPLSEWNWWNFPLDYSLQMVADYAIGWSLTGMVIAWRVH